MKKKILDLQVTEIQRFGDKYALLKCSDPGKSLPRMIPGQFAQLEVKGSAQTFLRRPLSIHQATSESVWFLVHLIGQGTRALARLQKGDTINVLLPLGKGYTFGDNPNEKPLLVGGGAGIAPLLFLGSEMKKKGIAPTFLLGARTQAELVELDQFRSLGEVYLSTEDGSLGERGFVTQHSLLDTPDFDHIYTCGPKPMMVAVGRYAREHQIPCQVSLENLMACGLGVCLCCVEDTTEGNLCVCKEGPVFDINRLKWLN